MPPSLSDFEGGIADRLSKTMWVVLMKDAEGKLTLLADPGLGRPWCARGPNPLRNQKTAEFHAKQCDGMAATWGDAFRLLSKENPLFEKELIQRARTVGRAAQSKAKGIVNEFGKPASPAE